MRLIASDFDGTFNVGSAEDRRRAVAAWQAAGNKIGIISGRAPADLPRLLEGMGIRCDFLAAASGAMICDGEGKTLWECHCAGEEIRPLLEKLFEGGCLFCNIVADRVCRVFGPKETPEQPFVSYDEAINLPFFYQISAYHVDDAAAAENARKLKQHFGGLVNPLQNGRFLDIVPGNMDKAEGIRQLISLWGVAPEDVIAVGDNLNDMAMIRAFPSYAMESGVQELKEAAGRVTETVAQMIDKELHQ